MHSFETLDIKGWGFTENEQDISPLLLNIVKMFIIYKSQSQYVKHISLYSNIKNTYLIILISFSMHSKNTKV